MPPTEVDDEENAEEVVEATAAGVESLPLRTTWSRLGPARSFFDPEIETLYRAFNSTVRRADVQYPFVSALICTLTVLIRECAQLQRPAALAATAVLATLALLLLVLVHLQLFGRTHWWKLLPLTSWCVLMSSVLMYVLFATDPLPSTGLEWYMLTVVMVYVCLPVRLPYSALLSLVTVVLYIALAVHLTSHSVHFRYRIAAGVVLLVGATALGATACLFHDLRQRRAYQETRKVMEVKASIEEQSKTRERLLMSVLPRHVAETMRQDWGRMDVGQFKKVYMNRHENVSILFADIVGFTAISSTYSAAGLVHVLNELFASFDRLAEQYHQLRIKILGDCYYCISGCPVERDDHAILSVQMGLSMVTAIKSVRESTNSTVDMRVGIHTGAVLAGVMGQKQWQFDVYSKDVELANKMESSGKPGRVHVSNKTLERLDNVFEVEPAYAEKRETNLRRAGLTTYFIVKPLQEVRASLGLQENGSDAATAGRPSVNEYVDDPGNPAKDEDGSDYRGRLESEITLSRQQLRDLMPHVKWLTLTFRDPEMEQGYRANREPTFGLSLICLPIALAFSSISQGIVTPSTRYTFISLTVGMIVLLVMAVFMIPIRWIKKFPRCVSSLGVMVQSSNSRTIGWIMVMNVVLLVCNLLDMMMCPLNSPFATRPLPHSYHNISECPVPQGPLDPHTLCIYPAHFSYLCVLILCTYPLQVEISHLLKLPLALAAAALHCWANLGYLAGLIDCASAVIYDHHGVLSERVELCVALLVTVLVVLILNFHAEVSSRIAFLWKREMTQQKAEAADLQQKNESLVENLLPPHVTQHFLHRDFRLQHEELYAQSFEEVGVLFASMPNFSDFYTEESVNNQGLECLRFLNEVISDYDALLDKIRYKGISKIKTIASSYMAASGLIATESLKGQPDRVRWEHLAILVEFALELRDTLNNINAESFNHFILQMGVNHGPVTAGVIGARKPHYDIWGNTVNVASRMESTGQAGYIQCTAETKEVLELFGYEFEQRGIINIKGKGQLLTYFLVGRKSQDSITADETHPVQDPNSLQT